MNNKSKKEPLSSNFWIIFISICIVLGIIMMFAYVAYYNRGEEIVEKNYDGAEINLDYDSDTSLLTLSDYHPTTITEGINAADDKFFEFSVDIKKKEAKTINYEVSVIRDRSSTIDDKDVKIYLEKFDGIEYKEAFKPKSFEPLEKESDGGTKAGSMVIYTDSVSKSVKEKFRLRMWLANTSTKTTGLYSIELAVNAKAE